MYMCTYAHIHTYIYIYTYLYIGIHIYIRIFVCIYIYIYIYTYIYIYLYIHTCVYIYMFASFFTYEYMFKYTDINIYIWIYIHTYTYTPTLTDRAKFVGGGVCNWKYSSLIVRGDPSCLYFSKCNCWQHNRSQIATHCNTLQHTATHCSILEHNRSQIYDCARVEFLFKNSRFVRATPRLFAISFMCTGFPPPPLQKKQRTNHMQLQ